MRNKSHAVHARMPHDRQRQATLGRHPSADSCSAVVDGRALAPGSAAYTPNPQPNPHAPAQRRPQRDKSYAIYPCMRGQAARTSSGMDEWSLGLGISSCTSNGLETVARIPKRPDGVREMA